MATREHLLKLRWQHRNDLRELNRLGVSRNDLVNAVVAVKAEGCWPQSDVADDGLRADLIAAKLFSTCANPQSIDWDKIIELINNLMPLIEMWLAMCV